MVRSARVAALSLAVACSSPPTTRDHAAGGATGPTASAPLDAALAAAPTDADSVVSVPAPVVDEALADRIHLLYSEHGNGVDAAVEWLVAHPAQARPALRAVVTDPNFTVAKRRAYQALARIGDVADVELLAAAMRTETETLRWTAGLALGAHGSAEAEAALFVALDDADGELVDIAAAALGERKAEAVRPRMEVWLDDAAPGRRWRAVRVLGELGHEKSAGALRKRARVERDGEVKKALRALGY